MAMASKTMAPDRNLLPRDEGTSSSIPTTTSSSSSSSSSRIQCTANVVGVLPSQINDILNAKDKDSHTAATATAITTTAAIATAADTTADATTLSAKLDDHSSGLSYLLHHHPSPSSTSYSSTTNNNENDELNFFRSITVWEHSTQTIHENLNAPNYGVCGVSLLHPEHYSSSYAAAAALALATTDSMTNDKKILMSDCLLVACLGGGCSTRRRVVVGGVVGGDHHRGGSRAAATANNLSTLRHVYAASPTSGVLCVWVLDAAVVNKLNSGTGGGKGMGGGAVGGGVVGGGLPCDASLRLKLKDFEVLTSLVPINPTTDGTSSWLLASSSHGRIWKIYKTFRPLTLHAKLVKKRMISSTSKKGDEGVSTLRSNEGREAETVSTGIVRGLYNYFTTPSKSSKYDDTSMMVEGGERKDGHGLFSTDDENIVALIPLPPPTTSLIEGNGATATDADVPRKNPGSTPSLSPPARKQQRLSNSIVSSSASSPPCSQIISLSSSLVLKKWNITMLAGMESMDGAGGSSAAAAAAGYAGNPEGYSSVTTLFPRNKDGTLDLSCLACAHVHKSNDSTATHTGERNESNMILEENANLEGYDSLDMLAAPALAKDGNSIIVGIRVSKRNDVDATRAYVVRVSLLATAGGVDEDGGRNAAPCILDAAWLDRYSGQSLSPAEGILECAGLVVAEDCEEGMVDEGNTSIVGGSVVYIGFGPRSGGGGSHGTGGGGALRSCPVTISALHFPSVNVAAPRNKEGSSGEPSPPRVKDLDLDSKIAPSIIHYSLSYDSLSGGCVMLATTGLLCGAHVRFPPLSSLRGGEGTTTTTTMTTAGVSLDDASLVLLAQDESVVTIKAHLLSSFRQYHAKLREGGGSIGISSTARAVIPPSITTCPVSILSAAVVLASKDYVCASSGDGGGIGGPGRGLSSPFVSRRNSSGGSSTPVTVLRDKLQLHKEFVTFLLHAGAYRRLSNAGRVRLRDHGEMITAARTLLIECQDYFTKVEAAIVRGDSSSRNELAQLRQMVMSALDGASNDVMNLPKRWANLQQLISSSGNTTPLKDVLLLMTSSSLCQGINDALTYRHNESIPLYDIPSFVSSSSSSSCSPWTSSTEMLSVVHAQLQFIHQMGEYILTTSKDYDTDKSNLQWHVGDLSAAVLSGYRDVVSCEPDNDGALRTYEATKSLTFHLLRQYVNDEGGDIVALNTSLDHSFFEGIVQICHDHRQGWMYQGPFSDEEPDDRYDLRTMIASSSSDSPYARLHQSRDYGTGLSFCNYVLRWYTDRGHYSEVFELGKHCLQDLSRFVRNDHRLSNLAWRQHLRVDWHEKATVDLLGITTPLLFGTEAGVMGLWEKDQMMSLAKLSNKLAVTNDGTHSKVVEQRAKSINNSLNLISAQRFLQEDDGFDNDAALDEDDVLKLAVERIESSSDADEIKGFGICGLSIASAKHPEQIEAMANAASHVWHAIIQADIDTWRDVANDNASAVGGMEEEVLIHRVEGTAFVCLLYDFLSKSTGGKMQNVGFGSANVQNQVLHALGSDELTKVLMLAADIVMNAT